MHPFNCDCSDHSSKWNGILLRRMRFSVVPSDSSHIFRSCPRRLSHGCCSLQGDSLRSMPNGTGPSAQRHANTSQPLSFDPLANHPPLHSPENAPISWAENLSSGRLLSSGAKEYQLAHKHVINVHAEAADVRAAPDNEPPPRSGCYQPDLAAPQLQAWQGQNPAPSQSFVTTGTTPTRPAHGHTRTISGIEMKDAYQDSDLDDEW